MHYVVAITIILKKQLLRVEMHIIVDYITFAISQFCYFWILIKSQLHVQDMFYWASFSFYLHVKKHKMIYSLSSQ